MSDQDIDEPSGAKEPTRRDVDFIFNMLKYLVEKPIIDMEAFLASSEYSHLDEILERLKRMAPNYGWSPSIFDGQPMPRSKHKAKIIIRDTSDGDEQSGGTDILPEDEDDIMPIAELNQARTIPRKRKRKGKVSPIHSVKRMVSRMRDRSESEEPTMMCRTRGRSRVGQRNKTRRRRDRNSSEESDTMRKTHGNDPVREPYMTRRTHYKSSSKEFQLTRRKCGRNSAREQNRTRRRHERSSSEEPNTMETPHGNDPIREPYMKRRTRYRSSSRRPQTTRSTRGRSPARELDIPRTTLKRVPTSSQNTTRNLPDRSTGLEPNTTRRTTRGRSSSRETIELLQLYARTREAINYRRRQAIEVARRVRTMGNGDSVAMPAPPRLQPQARPMAQTYRGEMKRHDPSSSSLPPLSGMDIRAHYPPPQPQPTAPPPSGAAAAAAYHTHSPPLQTRPQTRSEFRSQAYPNSALHGSSIYDSNFNNNLMNASHNDRYHNLPPSHPHSSPSTPLLYSYNERHLIRLRPTSPPLPHHHPIKLAENWLRISNSPNLSQVLSDLPSHQRAWESANDLAIYGPSDELLNVNMVIGRRGARLTIQQWSIHTRDVRSAMLEMRRLHPRDLRGERDSIERQREWVQDVMRTEVKRRREKREEEERREGDGVGVNTERAAARGDGRSLEGETWEIVEVVDGVEEGS